VLTASPNIAAVALYAGLLLIMNIVLQVRVIRLRRSRKIGIGDGQDRDLTRAARVHGNFVENAPFLMAALVILAVLDTRAVVLHALGVAFVAGRVLHAVGLHGSAGSSLGRVGGMVLTFLALGVSALLLILYGLSGFGL
jgi:hypothetical protein